MRKMLQTVVLAILLACNIQPVYMEDIQVKLENPGFENGLTGWKTNKIPPENKGISFEVANKGKSDSKSAKIISSGRGIGILTQDIDPDQWSSVHISGYVKCSLKDGFAFIDSAMIEGGPSKPPYPKCTPELSGNQDWTLVEGDFDLTPDTKSIRIGLTIIGEGWAMFDDISVTAIASKTQKTAIEIEKNLCDNGGFETLDGSGFKGWTTDNPTSVKQSKEAFEGTYCSWISNDTDKTVILSMSIDSSNFHAPLGLSGAIKTSDCKKASIQVEFTPDDSTKKPIVLGLIQCRESNGDWIKTQTMLRPAMDPGKLAVKCIVEGKGKAMFDSIEVGPVKRKQEQKGSFEEFWVENPLSGTKLCVHEFRPERFDESKLYPVIILLPGGNGYGTQLEQGGLPKRLATSLDAVTIVFDPDGRGKTKEGTDDISGPIHQAGLNEVTKFVARHPYVDKTNVGYYTMSFGIIMGACTAGRYPNNPPLKYILDWEGPDGHLCPTNHIGKYDMDFWGEREASDFIRKFPGIYIRMQSEKDHVQKTNDHAIRMINGATAKDYGGQGIAKYTRVNMKEGEYSNKPNTTYTSQSQPKWLSESIDRQLDKTAVEVLKELISMEPIDPDGPPPPPPDNENKEQLPGANRIGFLNPFGYPKYSQEATNTYFNSLNVANAKEYASKVMQELTILNPNVIRLDFFMFAGDQWKQMVLAIDPINNKQTRIIGTLVFREPGKPEQTAKKVSDVVEYFDGDGIDDNPSGITINDWQIENEINMGKIFWTGTTADYVNHLENCYKAAKKSNPQCNVMIAGKACDRENDVYKEVLEALNGKKAFDSADIHVYADKSDVMAVEKAAQTFRDQLEQAGFDNNIPLWMTEFGVRSTSNDKNPPESQMSQAKTFAQRAIQAAASKIEGSCYISVVDVYPDSTTSGTFDTMGLVASGLSTDEKSWTRRPVYWTYARLSELFSQISFESIQKKEHFGDAISSYTFDRPGQGKVMFMFVSNSDNLPKQLQAPLDQPFVYLPMVTGPDEPIKTQPIAVLPSQKETIIKFYQDIANGPIAIIIDSTRNISKKLGIYKEMSQQCVKESKCLDYEDPDNSSTLGISWMILKPDFSQGLEAGLTQTQEMIDVFTVRKVAPVIDISDFKVQSMQDYYKVLLSLSKRLVEIRESGSKTTIPLTDFILQPAADENSQQFAQKVIKTNTILKQASKSSNLIIYGQNNIDWWTAFIKEVSKDKNIKTSKPFDTFGLPPFKSVWADRDKNYKARQREIESYLQILKVNGLDGIRIASPSIGTVHDNPDNVDEDDQKHMAAELARLYALSLAGKSSHVGWDGISPQSSLFDSNSNKRLAYWTLSKLSQVMSTVRTTGRVKPGDDEFGSKLYKVSPNGMWITRFGIANQSFAIGWIDSDKPPQFSTQDYDLPFTTSLEIEYLVPDKIEQGKPVFKKIIISQKDGVFTFPADRYDPFIIKPTLEEAVPFVIAVNPPEISVMPGSSTTVKLKIIGCAGKISLSIPSTKLIAIEASSEQPDEKDEISLTVNVSKDAKGGKTDANISALCDNGQQATTTLSVVVSEKTSTKITLWIGKKKALVDNMEYELSVAPTVVSGKTLVPVRFISEAFGAKVQWDSKEQKIELVFGLQPDGNYTKKITLWVGKKTAMSDFGSKLPAYREHTLDVAPMIMTGTTMVPLRFISDVLGASTIWDDKEKRIDIVWKPL